MYKLPHRPLSVFLFLLAFCISTLVLNMIAPPRIAAQTSFVGINGDPCAYTTIGSAIAAAQKGDTIFISPGTYIEFLREIDISLTFVPAATGKDCQLEDLGANSATVIIDGNGASEDATGGLGEIIDGAEVTFRHMWLRNATATNGGVLAVTGGSTLILDDANVTDGAASSSGGNIYADANSGNFVHLINGSNVYRGEATLGDGGAIALFDGTLTVDSGGIGVSSNNGFSTAANNGGGIYAENATVNLNSSSAKVIWNQAGNDGGGIYGVNTRINLTDALIENNQTAASGGGIYLKRTTGANDLLSAAGASISHNETTNSGSNEGGGGLYLDGFIEAELNNTTVDDNSTNNAGGGLHIRTAVDLLLSNGTQVVNNASNSSGGGIYMAQSASSVTLDDSTIGNNTAGTRGGGIRSAFGSVFMRNDAVISENEADIGGGIDLIGTTSNNANTRIEATDSTIGLNKALGTGDTSGAGGGIHAIDTRISMTNTNITQNEANRRGGGIYITDSDSEVRVTEGAFSANRTLTGGSNQGGGAIYAETALEIYLDDVVVEGNQAVNSGGAFHIRSGVDLFMQGGWLDHNTSTGSGGAIYAAQSSTEISMTGTLVSDNSAGTTGGGFQFTFARGEFDNVTLQENSADNGGGAYFWFTEVELTNSRVLSNSASESGGGVFLNGTALNMQSVFGPNCDPFGLPANQYCTEIRGNTAAEYGGGVYLYGSSSPNYEGRLDLAHAALLDNLAPLGGTAIFADGTYTPTTIITNALIAGNGDNSDDSSTVEHDGAGSAQFDSVTLAGNFDNPLRLVDNSAQFSLTNSIIYENLGGPQVSFQVPIALLCNLSQSPDGNTRTLGTNENPQFTTSVRGDYRLGNTSPALDECNSGPPRDTDLGFRPVGARFDQGAFERGSTTNVFTLNVNGPSGTGSGTVTSEPAGIDCPAACSAEFSGGAEVTLSAAPGSGSTFDGWDNAECPGTDDCELTMLSNKSVAPSFTLNTYTLTVNTSGVGNVTSDPAGIDCGNPGADCSEEYDHGTSVNLTAAPGQDQEFAGWSGACTGTEDCVVSMTAARSVSAGFSQVNVSHTVTVAVSGNGQVTSSPAGIACGNDGEGGGADCSEAYPENTGIQLTATPDEGNEFTGWDGDCQDIGACDLLLDADKTVSATFAASLITHTLAVTTTGNGQGVVNSAPAGILCGGGNQACSAGYALNTQVTLTPTASAGSLFNGWDGDCVGVMTCTVNMTATRSVTASFALITHTLSVTTTGDGGGQVTSTPAGIACSPGGGTGCTAVYAAGTAVTLTASPAGGSDFTGWSGACSGVDSCSVTMDVSRAVTAAFAASTVSHTLSVTLTGDGGGTVIGEPVDGDDSGDDNGDDNGDNGGEAENIDCGGGGEGEICNQLYPLNSQVTLFATADTGSTFAGWEGACSGTDTCLVTLDAAKSVSARFTLDEVERQLTAAVVGNGSVTSVPAGIDCGETCAATFANGVTVALTPTAETGFVFSGWGGACSGDTSCALEMSSDLQVTGTFTVAQVQLVVSVVGDGEGAVASEPTGIDCGPTCQSSFAFGTQVTLTATADTGYAFVGWEGDCSDTGTDTGTDTDTCVLVLDAPKMAAARIVPVPGGSDEEEGDDAIYLPVLSTDP